MVTPSCFVRGVNTQKARRNLIDHSTPPQTFSFLIGLGKTEKKGLDQGIITKEFQKRSKTSVSAEVVAFLAVITLIKDCYKI